MDHKVEAIPMERSSFDFLAVSRVAMGLFRRAFMQVAGLQVTEPESKIRSVGGAKDVGATYGNIPAIPTDIGFGSGKKTSGVKPTGMMQNTLDNPGVILGLGLTTLALLGMMKSSFVGDKIGAQKFMRYRIMAQFFTVSALVAGVAIFGVTYKSPREEQ
ncbi:hypothetical protein AB6A40_001547 [Gnathostoma spinigerum]|uniref:HIG1 domain-containing protein n=1 Tax=Gnathostoma spinigerum TaxID=75299 RepID=A0ABD6E4K9_9BILA